MENDERIQKIKAEIDNLPQGNVIYKTIRGVKRMYLRRSENGARKEKYMGLSTKTL